MHHTRDIDLSFLDDAPVSAPAEPPTALWDTPTAIELMSNTDAELERLGSRGSDPAIQSAADACTNAYRGKDMPAVRAACQRIVERARELST